ncbi:ABC transporter permease [Cohaesibacter gelatinilyticus]|uniref:Spermidine/putrescine transport system permease protein n=1 Tax=Cohaesibacter gelatinilyticus TaxID=372072 RepID=A0A285PBY1_9HYPH|nr:ABC transporter permease [Cohaesibacter gelatinilyticus]SNZ19270.1 spermidine/putrescine transport system permease protein [Cohaesibacter gelatinilyticus]
MMRLGDMIRSHMALIPAMVVIGFFMILPILIILIYSFLAPGDYGGVKPEFSIDAYQRLLFQRDLFDHMVFDPAYLKIAFRSVWVAVVSVVGCLILGFPVAYYIACQPEERRNIYLLLITIPFWTNLLIRTYCWILVLRDTGLINGGLMRLGLIDEPLSLLYTEGAIALGLIYTYVPFMVLPIYAALERLDRRLIEAARDLYSSRWVALRHVVIPLAMPGIVAGSILVFIPALGAFIAPDLLGGGKNLMLGSLVQLQFSSARNWPFGSALAMIIMAMVLISLFFYARSARKNGGGIQH